MKIYTEILGNLSSPEWRARISGFDTEFVELDQWTAQKSRFVARGDDGGEYAVALERHSQLSDGDIIEVIPERMKVVALRVRLSDVMVVDLGALAAKSPETVIHMSVELGHAIGNQHWPAVVKGMKIYVPLTVDRKVMESVMRTHRFEDVAFDFQRGERIIPSLAPHEVRRLFGGTGPDSEAHRHLHAHAI